MIAAAFAWAGGAAFVLSLFYFLYTYAVTLADATAGTGSAASAAAFDCLLFLAFAGHHSLFARPRIKRWWLRLVPARLERSVYVWIASLLLAVVCAGWQPVPGLVYRHGGAWAFAHLAIVAFGVVLTALGARLLDPLDLAGIEQAVPSVAQRARPGDELVVAFPYSLVRHPIYLGWVLVVFGVPVMTWNRLLMALLSTCYLVLAVPWEERLLTRTFGPAYEAYKRRVRWRILPFVY